MNSSINLQQRVEDIVDEYNGDRYKAINWICNKAEELGKSVDYCLSESECIVWALSNLEPENLEERKRQHMNAITHRTHYLENLLGYIEDDDIIEAVRTSYDMSVRIDSLTFYYNNIRDKFKKVRVRILTRMCWYNRYNEQ